MQWVVAESLLEARARAGKVQGRRTTVDARPPLLDRMPPCPPGGVQLATQWVEPAYLEPDASWCEPGGEPASPLANGGAFGGKVHSRAPARRARARRPVRARRCASSTRAKTSCGSGRSVRRSRRSRSRATASSRSTAWSRAARAQPRVWPTPRRRRGAGALDRGRRRRSAGELRPARGRARRAGACSSRARSDRDVDVVTPSGARAQRAGRRRRRQGHARRRRRSRPAIRSTKSCCAPTRSAPRTWRSVGSRAKGSRSTPRPARSTTSRSVRSACCARRRRRRSPSRSSTIPRPPRARSTDAVFAAVAAATWNALGRPTTFPAPRR